MAAPTIVTIRPGVAFAPEAAASWARMEAQAGRRIDVNSSYRDWNTQYRAYRAYRAYVNGGPWAPYALHPDNSMHCRGLAVDSDDQTLLKSMPGHGWRQTALNVNEPWHFDYFAKYDRYIGQPSGGGSVPLPIPPKKETRDRDMRVIKRVIPAGTEYALVGTRFFQSTWSIPQANTWAEVWGDAANVTQAAWDEALAMAIL